MLLMLIHSSWVDNSRSLQSDALVIELKLQ